MSVLNIWGYFCIFKPCFQKLVVYWEGTCYIVFENPAFKLRDWSLFLVKQPVSLWEQKATYPNDLTTHVKT